VDLLVTGAPSSGSGVIERIAQDFGVRSGDCVRFNDAWLNDLGGSWLAPPRTNEMTWHRLDHDRLVGSSTLMDFAGESAEPVVLADPRLSLLLPLWDHLAKRSLPLVLVVRDPREVADSLGSRNGLSARKSIALWFDYLRQVLLASHARSMLIIDRGRLVSFPDTSLAAVASFISESVGVQVQTPGLELSAHLISLDRGSRNSRSIGGLSVSELAYLMDFYYQVAAAHGQVGARLSIPECPSWVDEVLDELLAARTARRAQEVSGESGELVGLLRDQVAGLEAERLAYLGQVGKLESEIARLVQERQAHGFGVGVGVGDWNGDVLRELRQALARCVELIDQLERDGAN